jgi:hypothetical protein
MSNFAILGVALAILALFGWVAWLHGFLMSGREHWGAVASLDDMEFEDSTGLPENAIEAARRAQPRVLPVKQPLLERDLSSAGNEFGWIGNFSSNHSRIARPRLKPTPVEQRRMSGSGDDPDHHRTAPGNQPRRKAT